MQRIPNLRTGRTVLPELPNPIKLTHPGGAHEEIDSGEGVIDGYDDE